MSGAYTNVEELGLELWGWGIKKKGDSNISKGQHLLYVWQLFQILEQEQKHQPYEPWRPEKVNQISVPNFRWAMYLKYFYEKSEKLNENWRRKCENTLRRWPGILTSAALRWKYAFICICLQYCLQRSSGVYTLEEFFHDNAKASYPESWDVTIFGRLSVFTEISILR